MRRDSSRTLASTARTLPVSWSTKRKSALCISLRREIPTSHRVENAVMAFCLFSFFLLSVFCALYYNLSIGLFRMNHDVVFALFLKTCVHISVDEHV